jgi:macrolide-specific efflux system membrane fusion protein
MSIKWWTENLSRKLTKRSGFIFGLALVIVLLGGCSLLPKEQLEEQLPTITPPAISQKPEYEVTTDTIEVKVRGIGKIMSRQEQELFFTYDQGRIREIYVQTGDYVEAGQLLAELDTEMLESQIRSKKVGMKQAELRMIEVLRNADDYTPEELEDEKVEFETQRLELVELEEKLEQAKITAPFSGTIVSVLYDRGDQVAEYEPVMVIADLSQLVVAAEISDSDIEKIAVGMEAIVDINAHGQFVGTVERLPVEKANNNNNNYYDPWNPRSNQPKTESIDDFMLVHLDDFPEGAARRTPLSVQVITQRKENVVVIPPAALRTLSGRYYVQVVEEDGTKREVDVEVGYQSATQVEIIKGLEPGQKVVGR